MRFQLLRAWYAPSVEPTQRPTFALAGAGATLIGFTSACIILGALIGWAAGSLPIGLLIGAVVGIPVGIFGVYRRYRDML
jgi:F0F1-type ATP synthase assembly protein I